MDRRIFLAHLAVGSGALLVPAMAHAQLGLGGFNPSSILGKATDSALDTLAKPGAFYNDEKVRIGLPIGGSGLGGLAGSLLGGASKLGLIDDVTRQINDAAGVAAGEAKPIFRDAIDDLSFSDAPDIIKQSDGGTQYLRRSSNDTLHAKLSPLIDSALGDMGVYGTIDSLAKDNSMVRKAGLNRETINRSVTDQGLDGIFTYVGKEEAAFRKNPIGGLGKTLGL